MKKIIIIIVFCFLLCGSLFAQTRLVELETIKSLKLLESTRSDAVKLLSNDIFPQSVSDYVEYFYTQNAVIKVIYASGKCSDAAEEWDVPEWKVTGITISPKEFLGLKSIGIDYSKFRKEKPRKQYKELKLYGDKKAGISILAYGERVESVSFSPSEKDFPRLCDKPQLKKYYSSKRLIVDDSRKNASYHNFPPPSVVDLKLSSEEIRGSDAAEIAVETNIANPMFDVVTYEYYVSGGKIVGRGAKVVWDLTGVESGIYKITGVADNGCGPCGKYITKSIVVK